MNKKIDLPDFVKNKLKDAVAKIPSTTMGILKDEYMKIYMDEFIQTDKSFCNDESRHKYALQIFWTHFIIRYIKPPSKKVIGHVCLEEQQKIGIVISFVEITMIGDSIPDIILEKEDYPYEMPKVIGIMPLKEMKK